MNKYHKGLILVEILYNEEFIVGSYDEIHDVYMLIPKESQSTFKYSVFSRDYVEDKTIFRPPIYIDSPLWKVLNNK